MLPERGSTVGCSFRGEGSLLGGSLGTALSSRHTCQQKRWGVKERKVGEVCSSLPLVLLGGE